MDKVGDAQTIAEQFEIYKKVYDEYDFFFIHSSTPINTGEDGNYDAKDKAVEEFDAALPILMEKKPDVIVVTGDHSTPTPMKAHSWHPQPVLIHSQFSGSDKLERFTDTGANLGSLGVFPAKDLIRYIQANAGMLEKFGA